MLGDKITPQNLFIVSYMKSAVSKLDQVTLYISIEYCKFLFYNASLKTNDW